MAQIVFTVFSKLSWMQSDRSILLFSKTGCLDLNWKQHQDSHSAGPCTFLNSADQPSISGLFACSWHGLGARTSIQNEWGRIKSRPLFGEWLIYSSWSVHFQEVRNTAMQGGHRVFVQQVKPWLRVGQNPRNKISPTPAAPASGVTKAFAEESSLWLRLDAKSACRTAFCLFFAQLQQSLCRI